MKVLVVGHIEPSSVIFHQLAKHNDIIIVDSHTAAQQSSTISESIIPYRGNPVPIETPRIADYSGEPKNYINGKKKYRRKY